jgi:DNA ligase-1
MQQILKIVNELQSTSGRNDKEDILRKYSDNELFKTILKFVFDPYVLSGLSSKKINKKIKGEVTNKFVSIEGVMNYLRINNTGKDVDILNVRSFIDHEPSLEIQELLKQIVTKSLKLGATANTFNKVYGEGFINQFEVMLAEKYFDHEEKLNDEFIVTTKLDGIRCVIIKENEALSVFSRQGQPIDDLVEILDEAKYLTDGYVYDGELILNNDKGLVSKDLYRETVKVARKDGEKKNLIFNCFDVVPVEDFKRGICNIPCESRKFHIGVIFNDYLPEGVMLNHIVEVPILYKGTDKLKIIELLENEIELGHEGVMVNIANAPYECKRSRGILKVKKMQDCDLRVVSIEEGEGRNSGTLGRVNVEYKGNVVGVGSGFSDEMRREVFNNPEKYIGRVAKVQYFEETSNSKDGKLSLRFPVFVEWREEGKEVSYF